MSLLIMHPIKKIKEEHVIIKRFLKEIESSITNKINRESLLNLLRKFESFWSQHEEKEERFFNTISNLENDFLYHKTIITDHKNLRGHWKILINYIKNKPDLDLQIALETDGKMFLDKFQEHLAHEGKYLSYNFRKA